MSDQDKALKLDILRILENNGFSYTNHSVEAYCARVKAEGFVMDGAGSFWSPGGESLVDAIYRGWSDSAPAIAPTKPAPITPANLPWSESAIANEKDPARRIRMQADNEEAAGMKHKSAAVKQGKLPPGMTQAQFDALPPDQKIAAANEATRIANGYSAGGVGF